MVSLVFADPLPYPVSLRQFVDANITPYASEVSNLPYRHASYSSFQGFIISLIVLIQCDHDRTSGKSLTSASIASFNIGS